MIDMLIEQLQDPNPAVRKRAIMALAKTKDMMAVRPLANLVRNDPVPELRDLALKAGQYIRQQVANQTRPSMPHVTPFKNLIDDNPDENEYYEDLGAEVLIEEIETTASKRPAPPFHAEDTETENAAPKKIAFDPGTEGAGDVFTTAESSAASDSTSTPFIDERSTGSEAPPEAPKPPRTMTTSMLMDEIEENAGLKPPSKPAPQPPSMNTRMLIDEIERDAQQPKPAAKVPPAKPASPPLMNTGMLIDEIERDAQQPKPAAKAPPPKPAIPASMNTGMLIDEIERAAGLPPSAKDEPKPAQPPKSPSMNTGMLIDEIEREAGIPPSSTSEQLAMQESEPTTEAQPEASALQDESSAPEASPFPKAEGEMDWYLETAPPVFEDTEVEAVEMSAPEAMAHVPATAQFENSAESLPDEEALLEIFAAPANSDEDEAGAAFTLENASEAEAYEEIPFDGDDAAVNDVLEDAELPRFAAYTSFDSDDETAFEADEQPALADYAPFDGGTETEPTASFMSAAEAAPAEPLADAVGWGETEADTALQPAGEMDDFLSEIEAQFEAEALEQIAAEVAGEAKLELRDPFETEDAFSTNEIAGEIEWLETTEPLAAPESSAASEAVEIDEPLDWLQAPDLLDEAETPLDSAEIETEDALDWLQAPDLVDEPETPAESETEDALDWLQAPDLPSAPETPLASAETKTEEAFGWQEAPELLDLPQNAFVPSSEAEIDAALDWLQTPDLPDAPETPAEAEEAEDAFDWLYASASPEEVEAAPSQDEIEAEDALDWLEAPDLLDAPDSPFPGDDPAFEPMETHEAADEPEIAAPTEAEPAPAALSAEPTPKADAVSPFTTFGEDELVFEWDEAPETRDAATDTAAPEPEDDYPDTGLFAAALYADEAMVEAPAAPPAPADPPKPAIRKPLRALGTTEPKAAEPAPEPEAKPLFEVDSTNTPAAESGEFKVTRGLTYGIPHEDQVRAKEYLDAAMSLSMRGDNARALKNLTAALGLNPNLINDSFFNNVASVVTGLEGDAAAQVIIDRAERKRFTDSAAQVQKERRVEQHLNVAKEATWGDVWFEVIIFLLIVVIGPIFASLVTVEMARNLLNSFAAVSSDLPEALQNVEMVTAAFSMPSLLPIGIVSGISWAVSLLVQTVLIHYAAKMFGGKGTWRHLVRVMLGFYNKWLPRIFLALYVAIAVGFVSLFSPIALCFVLILVVLSLYVSSQTANKIGEAYDFGTGKGCLSLLISLLVIGTVNLGILYVMAQSLITTLSTITTTGG